MAEKRPLNPTSPNESNQNLIQEQSQHAIGAAAAATTEEQLQDPIHHHHHRSRTNYDDQPIEHVPPPPYDAEHYGQLDINQNGLDTGARVGRDGRVNISIREKSRRVQDIFQPMLTRYADLKPKHEPEPEIPDGLGEREGRPPPPMNVVIQIVGSRGDVQPFVALGKVLAEKYKHRVRIATHPVFRDFVTENGLEFFSIGGDPAELMAFMVKNPGLMPGIESLKAGDIGKRRKGIYEIVNGCWRSCIESGDGTGVVASDELLEQHGLDAQVAMASDTQKPFVADAIIANPPSFAHVHIAEKLGIPLHLMFTMPWSPTQAFPHPLANIISANTDQGFANYISYAIVDMLTWQGLGDLINKFRERVLHLEPVSIIWAPGMLARLRVPWTYCWSPALIPKPRDWSTNIDISGFFFLNLATNYTPAPDLKAFLDAGPPPVYIGFGSIVVDDPNAMTTMIFEAVKKTGQRALVSKGWGGLGADELGIPEGVFMLGNVPHDWLFKHVSCVVHHGGAGTTAAGIAAGRPTVVVPFFGDQPFWGAMTARAGAGPMPTAYKDLTADKLAESIQEALKPSSVAKAAELSNKIKQETGAQTGAESFQKHLPTSRLRCSVCPDRIAVWRVRRTDVRLSTFAATVLGNEGLLQFEDLKLYRSCEYEIDQGPPEPIIGGAAALIGTLSEFGAGVADMPVEVLRALKFSEYKQRVSANNTTASSNSSAPATEVVSPVRVSSPTRMDSSRSVQDSPVDTDTKGKDRLVSNHQDSHTPSLVLSSEGQDSRAMSTVLESDGSHRRSWSRSLSGSCSREASRARVERMSQNLPTGHEVNQIGLESVMGAAKASGKIVKAGMKSPMDFTMSLAKGFHNAPKLYGDTTVRKPERVTDLQSGLVAAGKGFGYGFYDGITGLVTQPIRGAREEGAAGFVKGMARGAFGLVLKPGASIWGLPGYTFKGIYMELTKHFGSSTRNYIIAARTAQGYDEWKNSTPAQKQQVLEAWKNVKISKKRGKQKYGEDSPSGISSPRLASTSGQNNAELPSGFKNTRHMTFDERKELDKQRQTAKREEKERRKGQKQGSHATSSQVQSPASESVPMSSADLLAANEADFEEAIKRSVTQTSRGNPQEDSIVERAIRASVNALRNNPEPITDANEHEVYQRAVQASVDEAERARRELRAGGQDKQQTDQESEDEKAALRRALMLSLEDQGGQSREIEKESTRIQMHEYDHSDTEDDEDFKRAMQASLQPHSNPMGMGSQQTGVVARDDEVDDDLKRAMTASMDTSSHHRSNSNTEADEELQKAITLSEKESKDREAELAKQRTEEEIVMEYIKKQSLIEEEHRQKRQQQ